MSYQAVEAVFKHSRSQGSDQQVLVFLAHKAQVDGTDAHPSLAEIVEATHLHKDTVISAIRRLKEAGEIAYERGGGKGKRSRYHLLIMDGPAADTVRPGLTESGTGGARDTVGTVRNGLTVSGKNEAADTVGNDLTDPTVYGADTVMPGLTANSRSHLENPTTTIPPEVDEESRAANDALVVVVDEREEGKTPSRTLVEEMTALGMTPSIAERLAVKFDADRISRQIAFHRADIRAGVEMRNSGGRLRERIEKDWSPPPAAVPGPKGTRSPAQVKGYPLPSPSGADPRVSYSGPTTSGPPASPQSIRDILKNSGL